VEPADRQVFEVYHDTRGGWVLDSVLDEPYRDTYRMTRDEPGIAAADRRARLDATAARHGPDWWQWRFGAVALSRGADG
jgi:hypothetical protein